MAYLHHCLLALTLLALASGCISNQNASSTTTTFGKQTTTTLTAQTESVCDPRAQSCDLDSQQTRVEVYHFHRTSQCWSCKTLGEFAEKTVNTHFKKELESGRLKFDHINVQLSENKELAEKYGASGSSLMIGIYDSNGFSKEEDTKVWYKLNNEQEYISYLKSVIEAKLNQ